MPSNTQPARKKSCANCSTAKVRCDLVRPQCTRCRNRALDCIYIEPKSVDKWLLSVREATINDPFYLDNEGDLNFKRIELVRVVDEHKVRARWLQSLLPSDDQRPKPYTAATMKFAAQVLNSYPAMFTETSWPPFIHWAQIKVLKSKSLIEFATASRRWIELGLPSVDMMTAMSLEANMDGIYDSRAEYDQVELLAALQAYLLYTMMLFSHYCTKDEFVNTDYMVKLQDLAGDVVGKGTVCLTDTSRNPQAWESWIIASATQRTLYVLSLFDNLVNFTVGSPSFIATELAELLAPASKRLWNASTREIWKKAYDEYRREWGGDGQFLISELWVADEQRDVEGRRRVERWLSSVDEFGMMIYSVTSHTYGG